MKQFLSVALLTCSIIACGPKKDDTTITFPSNDQIVDGTAFEEGTYSISQIETLSQTSHAGENVVAYFRHKFANPGNPESGDETEHWMKGYDSSNRRVLQIAPEMTIPMQLQRSGSGIWMNEATYYWNYVRSNDGWKWRSVGTPTTRQGHDVLGLMESKPRGQLSEKALFEGRGNNKAAFTRDANGDLILFAKWSTADDGEVIAKIRYQKTRSYSAYGISRERGDYVLYSTNESKPIEPEPTPAPAPAPAPEQPKKNEIRLNERDSSIGSAKPGSAVVRNAQGGVSTLGTRAEIDAYAASRGYSGVVVDHAYDMASKSGNGLMGFAEARAQLSSTIADMVSHMKVSMNANSDGLELVFAIDYSGSMSNNIKAVTDELQTLVANFDNIVQAGRTVKVGIVTFGALGLEKRQLDLTADMKTVQTTLGQLYVDFGANRHSTDPGEACYSGLDCAAREISWSSSNRQIIVITDEESYEIATHKDEYIAKVESNLKQAKVYPVLVRLQD